MVFFSSSFLPLAINIMWGDVVAVSTIYSCVPLDSRNLLVGKLWSSVWSWFYLITCQFQSCLLEENVFNITKLLDSLHRHCPFSLYRRFSYLVSLFETWLLFIFCIFLLLRFFYLLFIFGINLSLGALYSILYTLRNFDVTLFAGFP